MAKIESTNGAVLAQVDQAHQAVRMSPRPMQAAGYYRYAAVTGLVTGVAAQAELLQMRWSSATHLALIQELTVRAVVTTAFTTAQEMGFNTAQCTGWSAVGSGGSQTVPAATNLMKRTDFPTSQVNDLRIATTAALGVGAKTIFGSNFWEKNGYAGAVGAVVVDHVLDLADQSGEYPMVLQANEGIILRNGPVAMGAAGVVRLAVELAWAEVLIADYPRV